MSINKEKCNAWCDLFLAVTNLTKELTKEECRYIKASFSVKLGNLELQELEHRYKEGEMKNDYSI